MLSMLSNIVNFQFGGFYGGSFGDLLLYWEQLGVFSYVLPFLLIFAVVFGILTKIKVFGDHRGLNAVIALVVGLLSLQYNLVPIFFSEIFPRVGIAISIILVLLVLVGLFLDPESKAMNWGLFGIGVIIFLSVLVKTAGSLGWYSAYWWYANWPSILLGLVVIGIFFAVISSVGQREPSTGPKVFALKE
ncbi:MAG TPA: hypothetical protein VJ142_01385 [Candidatus Nanoarchaeia archaeon]|nr:hypothetical protein [Candidatus Nanoarchaeia archaeon]